MFEKKLVQVERNGQSSKGDRTKGFYGTYTFERSNQYLFRYYGPGSFDQ